MRVYQMLSSLSYGDAIGNVVLALKEAIQKLGYETEVYAEEIDTRLPAGAAKRIQYMPELHKDDVVINHLSNGTSWNRRFGDFCCRKVIYYHNITPPRFFSDFSVELQLNCHKGLKDAEYLADKVDYCLAVSEFNKQDLRRMGYRQRIDILPILVPYKDYDKAPSQEIMDRYGDGRTNILFTGRISPNKKQEDIIKAFFYYKNYMDQDARLFLVGKYTGMEEYYEQLKRYTEALELKDVYFTGHIKFDEILAYYRVADVFACMSEHEGFCVPLVEAMYFGVPIVAYDSSAIADTLGNVGILTEDKDPKLVAEIINRLVQDETLRKEIISRQKEQLKRFEYDKVTSLFSGYLEKFLEEHNEG